MNDDSLEITPRATKEAIYSDTLRRTAIKTDKMFACLMLVQWVFGVIVAIAVSPYSWSEGHKEIHIHVWLALFLGGAISGIPIYLGIFRSGQVETRQSMAVAQMLFSSLLVHLTDGRIETHFHVFGSLVFLSFYKDWRVILTATLVTGTDHFIRAYYFPQTIFGVITVSNLRWLEYVAWFTFEDFFLLYNIRATLADLKISALAQEGLFNQNDEIKRQVDNRTKELKASLERVEQANRYKSEFLANISHEIRTPMNSIVGMVDLFSESPLNEEQKKSIAAGCDQHLSKPIKKPTLFQALDSISNNSQMKSNEEAA